MGKVVTTPSRGAVRVGDDDELDTRGRGTRLMRLGLHGPGAHDPRVLALLGDINRHIMQPRYPLPSERARSGESVYVDLLSILQRHGVVDYVSQRDVQQRLFPMYRDMELVRPDETVQDGRKTLSWPIDTAGRVQVTFRHNTEATAALRRNGTTTFLGADRAPYTTRETRREENENKRTGHLYIQINIMKVDARGVEITDPDVPGYWRAYGVALPLKREAGRRTVPFEIGGTALPSEEAFTNVVLSERDRQRRADARDKTRSARS